MTDKFQPGEVAVLTNDIGGRLFTVEKTVELKPSGHKRCFEKARRPGGLDFDVAETNLVKVKDRDAAVSLVAVLRYIAETHRREAGELRQKADGAAIRAVAEARIDTWSDDD